MRWDSCDAASDTFEYSVCLDLMSVLIRSQLFFICSTKAQRGNILRPRRNNDRRSLLHNVGGGPSEQNYDEQNYETEQR